MENPAPPVVLIIAGHDPSGAAGVQADIESVSANGGRAITLLTSLTAQNTGEFQKLTPQNVSDFRLQAKLLIKDVKINACKIGMLGNTDIALAIADLLDDMNNTPVVLDPILKTGTGTRVVNTELINVIKNNLFPKVTLITPNIDEAKQLSEESDINIAAQQLINRGCEHVLITGADEQTELVENRYFTSETYKLYQWQRLDGNYHGSGCTLSSAIATQLACGKIIELAVEESQRYTWNCLNSGLQIGKKQIHPNRFA